ncbi:MAG: biotin--[acetyl-CoA-carboxylase] ligase [Oscillospiraceae bacterium]
MEIKLEAFESLDSTNTYLKKRAAGGAPEGTVVIANAQTAGRGRMGRSFASAPGLGIYMSMLLRPDAEAECVQSLTAGTAVAVCRAVERVCGVAPGIKWINDLFLKGKKICGILCESSLKDEKAEYVVLGIGLNVITRPQDFPEELRGTAGSLYSQTGTVFERGKLISAMISELCAMYEAWKTDPRALLDDYRRRCIVLGKTVEVSPVAGGVFTAAAEEISDDFGLVLRLPDGSTSTVHSGEVSISQIQEDRS